RPHDVILAQTCRIGRPEDRQFAIGRTIAEQLRAGAHGFDEVEAAVAPVGDRQLEILVRLATEVGFGTVVAGSDLAVVVDDELAGEVAEGIPRNDAALQVVPGAGDGGEGMRLHREDIADRRSARSEVLTAVGPGSGCTDHELVLRLDAVDRASGGELAGNFRIGGDVEQRLTVVAAGDLSALEVEMTHEGAAKVVDGAVLAAD